MSRVLVRNSVSEDGSVGGDVSYSAGGESKKSEQQKRRPRSTSGRSETDDEESWTPFIIASLIGCVGAMSATMLFRSGGQTFK